MILTNEQQRIVEANMGLVGKVIKDKVHDVNRLGIYSYDDLFQIGCIGLCKAAATDKGGHFSTYAYRLIWNSICDALIYTSRRSMTEIPTDDSILETAADADDFSGLRVDLQAAVDKAKSDASPSMRRNIEALILTAQGCSSEEIGAMLDTTAGAARAMASRAKKYLKGCPGIAALG